MKRILDGIAPIYYGLALAWWRWALREIDPLHKDVPRIVHRINELKEMTA